MESQPSLSVKGTTMKSVEDKDLRGIFVVRKDGGIRQPSDNRRFAMVFATDTKSC